MNDIRSCIYRVPIFQVLPQDSILRLQQAMHHQRLAPGQVAVSAGQPVDHLVVVSSGLLKLTKVARSGREQVLRELGPGEFFGEMGLFAPLVAEADLVAVTETDACLLRRSAVQAELTSHPEVALALVEALAQRLAEAERTIGEIALLDVGQRLASELLRLAQAQRTGHSGPVTFEIPYTWAEMASRLAT
ncbi:MAG TPA: Crp/Fnr family transcriptional regulator, partial [Limnochordales bacterium]